MTIQDGNLFQDLPEGLGEEAMETLVSRGGMRLVRIVSTGQATADGAWYDQTDWEWVVLLKGSAGLRFAGEAEARALAPGDFVHIPAHARHRVEWTAADEPTVWLALHYEGQKR
ncbi:MAG TPA: cupin domain-containing protein [Alphaproteobacteria bacterium]|nr:cupin domain-containing protein [Alphaproteobacteria bacterium]